MDFLDFKNCLINHNILLFDAQYRIAHYRFNKYINVKNIGNIDATLLSHLVNGLLNNNQDKINYIKNLIIS